MYFGIARTRGKVVSPALIENVKQKALNKEILTDGRTNLMMISKWFFDNRIALSSVLFDILLIFGWIC